MSLRVSSWLSVKWAGRALRWRNYRLFFVGQGISLIGTWMQRMALPWFVYSWTHSPWVLGTLDFSSQIPAFLIAPWAGVAADRFHRHRLLIATQTAAMLQAGMLAALVLTGRIQIWHLYGLAMFLGVINGFDMPVRQSFVVHMVGDRRDLPSAIALNSSLVNAARLIGPSLAGFILALTSAGICFLLNALSYLAVLASLLLMHVTPQEKMTRGEGGLRGLREGLAYVRGIRTIPHLLLNLLLVGVFGGPYMMLMPVFAKQILHGGPQTLGLLIAAVGCGALGGALFLASRPSVRGLGRIMAAAMAAYALALQAFCHSRWLPLSLFLMLFTGSGMMLVMAGTNTLLQTLVEEEKRGRVMALHSMAFMGGQPLGSLWAGAVATHFGAPFAVYIGSLACLAATALFVSRLPAMRREIGPLLDKASAPTGTAWDKPTTGDGD